MTERTKRCLDNDKAKGRITKQAFQESKARQTFRRNKYFLPPDTCAHQGVRNVGFSENLACFVFLKPALRFALLPYYRQINILFRDNCMNFNIFLLKIEKLSEFLTFLSRFFHSVTMNGKSEFLIKCMPNTELR